MTTGNLNDIDAPTLKEWLDQDRAELIDIREPDEYAREHIPGSRLVPLSAFNPDDIPGNHKKSAVFYCQSGNRTREAATSIIATGFKDVYQLSGGLQGWRSAGLPMSVNRKAPISIMRQVQITAGGMVVLGAVLAALISPWFILLSGFVGAGLVYSGASGTCAMAMMLSLMPWNRRSADASQLAAEAG